MVSNEERDFRFERSSVTSEPFNATRLIVESSLRLNTAIRRADLSWTYKPMLATIEANWSSPEVQAWSDEFTAKCNEIDLEFTAVAFDEHDPVQISIPSKNHLLWSTLPYLDSELLLHDVAFDSALTSRCVQTIEATTWPTPYCLMLHGTGLLSRTFHVAYVPSTDAYLRKLIANRDEAYCGKGSDVKRQTLHDLINGMSSTGRRIGWKTTTF